MEQSVSFKMAAVLLQFPKIEFSKKTQKSLVGSQENRTFALAKTK